MKRREFLRISTSLGLAAVALGSAKYLATMLLPSAGRASGGDGVTLTIRPALKEMVDQTTANVWVFDDGLNGPRLPGVTIHAVEGEEVRVTLINENTIPHEFAVWDGREFVPGTRSAVVLPGESLEVSFPAPAGGTYMYVDPRNWPVHRVMGLNGVLIVEPAAQNGTPYSNATPTVLRLFGDLGNPEVKLPDGEVRFPGDPWMPERTWSWVFHSIAPVRHAQAQARADEGLETSPEEFTAGYTPTYFLLTGKSGFFASHDPEIAPFGNIGMPALLRSMNAGLTTHSPHIHGNHVYELMVNGEVLDNLFSLDTWGVAPGEIRDQLLPFVIPEDNSVWPLPDIQVGEELLSQYPVIFPMHCHIEPSQTAAGGNYPQGAVTHWYILSPQVGGPVDPALVGTHPDVRIFGDFEHPDNQGA